VNDSSPYTDDLRTCIRSPNPIVAKDFNGRLIDLLNNPSTDKGVLIFLQNLAKVVIANEKELTSSKICTRDHCNSSFVVCAKNSMIFSLAIILTILFYDLII